MDNAIVGSDRCLIMENAKRCSPFLLSCSRKVGLLWNKRNTSVLSNGLIWFRAAMSISEILTGTLSAPRVILVRL